MGLFDRLSREGRERSALEKSMKATANKNKLSADRFAAMEKLRDIGTDEALYGLARRFSFRYDKTIEDENEKEWVHDTLVGAGDRAIGPVRRYLLEAKTVSYPLRVLEKIASPGRLFEMVDELLEREEPGYTRDPTRKVQILGWLGEWRGARGADVARRIVPYLGDFDEGVRFAAVEALSHQKDEATALTPLLDALLRPEEESRRVKVRVLELLAESGWRISERKDAVAPLLGESFPDFGMQHDKIVRKKER
jgi:hypothetical protein